MAISKAKEEGAKVVICASTGNTSAAAAAYAARASSNPQHCGSTASENTTVGPRQRSAHSGRLSNWRQCPYSPLTSGGSFKTLLTLSYTQSQQKVILGVTKFA